MANHNKKFEKQMRNLLKAIDNNETIDYEDQTIRRCVYECVQRGYVTGYHKCDCTTDNTIVFDYSNPRVEKAGYEFLYPKINWIQIITLLASVIAALCSVISLLTELI